VAQLVVVNQVLVAQRDPEHPLTHQARTECSTRPAVR
jgi:hypothetical protein